jgi:hypothetical protein
MPLNIPRVDTESKRDHFARTGMEIPHRRLFADIKGQRIGCASDIGETLLCARLLCLCSNCRPKILSIPWCQKSSIIVVFAKLSPSMLSNFFSASGKSCKSLNALTEYSATQVDMVACVIIGWWKTGLWVNSRQVGSNASLYRYSVVGASLGNKHRHTACAHGLSKGGGKGW